jgi:hypothetical protein
MSAKDSKLRWGPHHLNLNVICAVDVRVGGESPETSDLLEVCFMPLNHSYRPHQEFAPFNICIKPSYPVDLKTARLSKDRFQEQFLTSAFEAVKAVELLEHWWSAIRARPNNQLVCMAWDWTRVQPWLRYWLDPIYSEIISESHRDLVSLLNFINDREDYYGEEPPYKAPTLQQLITRSNVQLIDRNSLLANCKAMSDCYRYLLHNR